jgi:hypothetical protein
VWSIIFCIYIIYKMPKKESKREIITEEKELVKVTAEPEVAEPAAPVPAPEPAPESAPSNPDLEKPQTPLVETMERDVKKCCCALSEDARKTFHCCVRSWSLCLNGCECCCGGLSCVCISLSNVALAFKGCLEQMDCDGH